MMIGQCDSRKLIDGAGDEIRFDPFQSIAVAARVSGMSKGTIYRWRREKHIPNRLNQGKLEFYLPAFVAHWKVKLVAYEQIYGLQVARQNEGSL